MALIYIFIKIYPVFGIALAVGCFDLSRSFKRKGNRAWIGLLLFSLLFALSSLVWIYFRGDKNAEAWFHSVNQWLLGK